MIQGQRIRAGRGQEGDPGYNPGRGNEGSHKVAGVEKEVH